MKKTLLSVAFLSAISVTFACGGDNIWECHTDRAPQTASEAQKQEDKTRASDPDKEIIVSMTQEGLNAASDFAEVLRANSKGSESQEGSRLVDRHSSIVSTSYQGSRPYGGCSW